MSTPTAIPPEPWHLRGTMHLRIWTVPTEALPDSLAAASPDGSRPRRWRGRALVGSAVVRYGAGGILAYDELLVATLAGDDRHLHVTISDIWVDSPTSLEGGRSLWAIPKRLARFSHGELRRGGTSHHAAEEGRPLAELRTVPTTTLPGRWPLRLTIAQRLGGREVVSGVVMTATVRPVRSVWRFPETSPLAWLDAGRPLASLTLDRCAIVFGDGGPGPAEAPTPVTTPVTPPDDPDGVAVRG